MRGPGKAANCSSLLLSFAPTKLELLAVTYANSMNCEMFDSNSYDFGFRPTNLPCCE